jgi:hypothetical protein
MTGVWAVVRLDLQQAQQSLTELERDLDEFAGKDVKIEVDDLTGAGGAAPAVARVGREIDHAEERAIAQAARAQALRRAIARRARARLAKRTAGSVAERAGAGEAAGAVSRATPLGWIVGAAIVAGVVGLRLISGKPLEGTAEAINRVVLGDEDDKARATRRTREWLEGSPVVGEIGRNPRILDQMSQVARIQETIFERDEKGASLIREHFPVNSKLDLMILAFAASMRTAWKQLGGGQSIADLRNSYKGYIAEYEARRHG